MSADYPHDTEKPPLLSWRPPSVPGTGPDITLDFTRNPKAAHPFYDWLKSDEAWAAFGDWYDGGKFRRYRDADYNPTLGTFDIKRKPGAS